VKGADAEDKEANQYGMEASDVGFRRRLLHWIGYKAVPCWPDDPPWAQDIIYTDLYAELSWWDRILVLLSGRFAARVVIHTEQKPGRVQSASTCWPAAPRWTEARHDDA